MSTFLEICQSVGEKSGTVAGKQPTTVSSQTGRLGLIVEFVKDAWLEIQNLHPDWLFMRREFSVNTIAGTARYTAQSFGITDHAAWIAEKDETTLYETAKGQMDEREISHISYASWRKSFNRGVQVNKRPSYFSVSDAGEIVFGPIPDDDYTVRGLYRKTPQSLVNDGDVPQIDVQYHDIIKYRARMFLAEYDEAPTEFAASKTNYGRTLNILEREQLPTTVFSGIPLA